MKSHLLRAARLVTPETEINDGAVLIERGTIVAAGPREGLRAPAEAGESELGDCILIPGFVDLHIHGAGGHDVMAGTAENLAGTARNAARHGTTTILATTVTASREDTLRSLGAMANYIAGPQNQEPGRSEIAGIHLEGPFISPTRGGVHPLAQIVRPDAAFFQEMCEAAAGYVRILTLAPELPGALELVRDAIARGMIVSMGHTNATYEDALAAIEAGASHATHVFNAMRPFSHRDPGILGAILTDSRVYAELIADGVHVEPAAIRLLLAAKGLEKILLVSDATSATGMPDGNYQLGNFMIAVRGGICRDAHGRLAGSTLTLDRAVRLMAGLGAPLSVVARMATSLPASRVKLSKKGALAAGCDADCIVMTPDLRIERVMARGKWVE